MINIIISTPTLITGGAENMVARLATNISQSEANVTVISYGKADIGTLEEKITNAGIPLLFLCEGKKNIIKRCLNTWKSLSKNKPDIIHSHIGATLYAIPWVFFHKCKLVHTVHTKPNFEFSRKVRFVFRLLIKMNKLCIVAVSKENQKIAQEYYGFGDDKVKYVNNPVETNRYYKRKNRTDNNIVFINVSRQDVNKNQILALKAMSLIVEQIPNSKLVLVGNGNQHKILKEETKKLGIENNVYFAGEVSNVEKYLAEADIYISTSHREALPLSMLEAMASELPIISTNVGGIPDIVIDNGILIEDDNLEQLVDAMLVLANNRIQREEFGKRSKEIVKNFDAEKCADNYLKIYKESVGKRG